MTIECKFAIKDRVFFMQGNKVQDENICSINVSVIGTEQTVQYNVTNCGTRLFDKDLFLTKSELLKTL